MLRGAANLAHRSPRHLSRSIPSLSVSAARSSSYSAVEIIGKKRDGQKLSMDEIKWFLESFKRRNDGQLGENEQGVADYQMAAFLMATYVNNMSSEETAQMLLSYTQSGQILQWPDVKSSVVDKHSTGGVGDKVSLPLAPLAVSMGLTVPMVSGRGLGHTGGTLDKLDSIPGFRTDLDTDTFQAIVKEIGCGIIFPTKDVAPLDKTIYALRDVTATVMSTPLIIASIMSKKLAEGLDALLLDVKHGCGTNLTSWEQSMELSLGMVQAGNLAGVNTLSIISDMEQPLGCKVGNFLEIEESTAVLKGEGPEDLTELVIAQAALMQYISKGGPYVFEECLDNARKTLKTDRPLQVWRDMVEKQGGSLDAIDNPEKYKQTKLSDTITAQEDGIITRMDAKLIGQAAVMMGCGRATVEDQIDLPAGLVIEKKVGDRVCKGDTIMNVYSNHKDKMDAVLGRYQDAIKIGKAEDLEERPLIWGIVDNDGFRKWDVWKADQEKLTKSY